MKTLLITGVAGFLGSHLADYYLSKDYKVIGLDNLSTGREENIGHLSNESNFQFFKHDIVNPLPSEVGEMSYDLILNMACPASPPKYQELAFETLNVCSVGLWNLIELSLKNKARLIHSSTSEVYGDPSFSPQTESYWGNVNSYGPRSMYDEGKRFGEAMLWTAQHKLNLNAGIVRIFNTYGPKMAPDDGRVVSSLIVESLAGNPLTLHGDGTQTRSFCYVSDLVKGIALLAESGEQTPVNLGNPNEFTIIELAEKILKLTGSKSTITFLPRPVDDPNQRKPDIKKAKQVLGWQPEVELDEGLNETIKYFQS
jgi:nucleoside-diphosphate-sugar epimerase